MNWQDTFPDTNKYWHTDEGILYNANNLQILKKIPANSIDIVITSPPYWSLRDYGISNQIGLEETTAKYLHKLWKIFDEIKRILKPTGTIWINMGDTYSGSGKGVGGDGSAKERWAFKKRPLIHEDIPRKSLHMIPKRFAIGMIERGWTLRNQIIWHKPNAMPTSAKDRFTVDFEKIFFFTKNPKYYFKQILEPVKESSLKRAQYKYNAKKTNFAINLQTNNDSIGRRLTKPEGRNKRTTWSISTKSYKGNHSAVFPPDIPRICIEAGCPMEPDSIVLDPFLGSGTTAMVAREFNRRWIGIELNPKYCKLARRRLQNNNLVKFLI